jgi:hypothetical protein
LLGDEILNKLHRKQTLYKQSLARLRNSVDVVAMRRVAMSSYWGSRGCHMCWHCALCDAPRRCHTAPGVGECDMTSHDLTAVLLIPATNRLSYGAA